MMRPHEYIGLAVRLAVKTGYLGQHEIAVIKVCASLLCPALLRRRVLWQLHIHPDTVSPDAGYHL